MAHLTRVAAAFTLAMAAGYLFPVSAFSADPAAQTPSLPHRVPQAKEDTGSGSSEALGDQLERSNGVIRPPTGVDPGMTQPPPPSAGRTPVIPPPGTPGGKRNVNPK